jgi:hypothetical protein
LADSLQFFAAKIGKTDAINLHFALYSLPILQVLPRGVPVTFSFHGPVGVESKQEGAGWGGDNPA